MTKVAYKRIFIGRVTLVFVSSVLPLVPPKVSVCCLDCAEAVWLHDGRLPHNGDRRVDKGHCVVEVTQVKEKRSGQSFTLFSQNTCSSLYFLGHNCPMVVKNYISWPYFLGFQWPTFYLVYISWVTGRTYVLRMKYTVFFKYCFCVLIILSFKIFQWS